MNASTSTTTTADISVAAPTAAPVTGAATPPRIPARHEIPLADTWDLTPLYPDDEAWQRDFADLKGRYADLGQFAGRLAESPATLRDCLESDKSLGLQLERLNHYASLKAAEDSASAANLARESQLAALYPLLGEVSAFIAPEIQALPDPTFAAFRAAPELAEWDIPLRRIRRLRAHTLSQPEERLLALGESALWGYRETFSQLTDVDMDFGTVADERGAARPLSQGSYAAFLVNRDPRVRRDAFHRFYAEFDGHKYTLAASLAHSVKADVFRARARNYPSALAAALFADDVPVAVYDQLIAAVRANLGPLFRYYELRRRRLGLAELHQYDTYVPLVAEVDRHTPFTAAIELVLDALQPLGEDYRRVLRDGLVHRRWCDRYESRGKRSGAFSSGSYGSPPYILMNYREEVFDHVYTLAHEAGHSLHTWLAQNHQPFQTYNYPIFLAEVASTFNEELLTAHLLDRTTDPRLRAYLINRQLDDIRGTVFRQTMFAEFERAIHAMEEAGEPLTLASFRAVYRQLLAAYFGDAATIDPELELECLRIPHFYSAFYVYKYATGHAAALALADRVRAGGAPAVAAYLDFLKAGGAGFPIPTLRAAGVDMGTPEPVARALKLFDERVAELETLIG